MAFHPYPQLIRYVLNRTRFEPPVNFTSPSLWSWIDHPVSGLFYSTLALLRLAFALTTYLKYLILPLRITRWPILQKVRHHTVVLCLLVGARFQVLFHSPFGVLFTFPSRYLFAIGHMLVFSLRGWSPYLHNGFLVSGATFLPGLFKVRLQDCHFLWFIFPDDSTS